MLKTFSLITLLIYFAGLLFAVAREKKNNNTLDYFFAGRTLPFWALSITFIASWWGAGSALSTADLAFKDGMGAFWYYGVPVLLSAFLLIVIARTIRKIGFLTQGRMFEVRYSPLCAKLISLSILIFMTVSAASQMVGVGDFFGTYLGMNYEIAVLVGTGIVLIYSFFGGFRGVVLSDIIQFVLLAISALVVFFIAFDKAGGIDGIRLAAKQANKPEFFSLSHGAKEYFAYVITFGCAWMIQANVWQRVSAAKNTSDARKMAVMSFVAYIPLYLIVVLTGMAGIALYDTRPQGGIITAIVMHHTPALLGAIVFVGISAAIMSTMDSLINTGAMTLVLDILPRPKNYHTAESREIQTSRMATLVVTLVALIISLRIRSILDISWIASDIITTGIFIPLIGAFIWKRGTSQGAIASISVGAIYCTYNLLIFLGCNLPAYWEQQSAKQAIIGIALSAIVFITVSLLTPAQPEKVAAFHAGE